MSHVAIRIRGADSPTGAPLGTVIHVVEREWDVGAYRLITLGEGGVIPSYLALDFLELSPNISPDDERIPALAAAVRDAGVVLHYRSEAEQHYERIFGERYVMWEPTTPPPPR